MLLSAGSSALTEIEFGLVAGLSAVSEVQDNATVILKRAGVAENETRSADSFRQNDCEHFRWVRVEDHKACERCAPPVDAVAAIVPTHRMLHWRLRCAERAQTGWIRSRSTTPASFQYCETSPPVFHNPRSRCSHRF